MAKKAKNKFYGSVSGDRTFYDWGLEDMTAEVRHWNLGVRVDALVDPHGFPVIHIWMNGGSGNKKLKQRIATIYLEDGKIPTVADSGEEVEGGRTSERQVGKPAILDGEV